MDTLVSAQSTFAAYTILVNTDAARAFRDITDDVQDAIQASGVENGLAVVTSQHTTAAIVVNEHEPELLKDLDTFLHRLAPASADYLHNRVPCEPGEGPNGHAHCQSLLLNTSATLPVVAGRAALGRWQRVFLVELDRPRPRQVAVTLIGA